MTRHVECLEKTLAIQILWGPVSFKGKIWDTSLNVWFHFAEFLRRVNGSTCTRWNIVKTATNEERISWSNLFWKGSGENEILRLDEINTWKEDTSVLSLTHYRSCYVIIVWATSVTSTRVVELYGLPSHLFCWTKALFSQGIWENVCMIGNATSLQHIKIDV